MMDRDQKPTLPFSGWTLTAVLCILCLIVRQPRLLALPIFGDEAIYLRWAQLVRQGHWWVSLCDPKPPLHFWILATVFSLTRDPLMAARMVSVFAGVLSIPSLMLACYELGFLIRNDHRQDMSSLSPRASGHSIGLMAAILMIFCPFLAFYQRLATADALFVFEMLVIVWLSLRWARLLIGGGAGAGSWKAVIALAISLGVAMLTRQGLSYLLWGMPVAAAVSSWFTNPGATFGKSIARGIAQLTIALAIAGILWLPFLLVNLSQSAADTGGNLPALKARIFYQGGFTSGGDNRIPVIKENLSKTFIPTPAGTGVPETGWLFLYLTPAVYGISLAGIAWLALRRQWWLGLFLTAWLLLMLVAPIVLLSTLYSRYVLAGTVPLLIAAAYILSETLAWIVTRRASPAVLWACAFVILAGLLAAPLRQIGLQTTQPNHQLLTRQDRNQYLLGWTAGGPARSAITAIEDASRRGPIVLITDQGWGNPADAAWVYLSRLPNVTLFYTPASNGVILPPTASGAYLLRKNKYLFTPPEAVELSPEVAIFYITNDPVHAATGDLPAEKYFRAANANLGDPIPFKGMEGSERVLLFPLTLEGAQTIPEVPRE